MRASRALLLAAAVALTASIGPVASRANTGCPVLVDPSGDARVAGMQPTPDRVPVASVDRLDLTSAGIASDANALEVVLGLRSLATRPTGTERDTYTLSWDARGRTFELTAIATSQSWSFTEAISHDSWRTEHPIAGTIDVPHAWITLTVPMSRDVAVGDLLTHVHAETLESNRVDSTHLRATAPGVHGDAADGIDAVVTDGCARPLTSTAERCSLLGDAAGDVQRTPVTDDADAAVDVRSVRAGTNAGALVLEINVTSVSQSIPDGVDARRWTASWQLGSDGYHADALVDRASRHFTWTAPDGTTSDTSGLVDPTHNAIVIVVPRGAIALGDGTQVTGITAHAADVAKDAVELQSDDAPDRADDGPSYVAGVSCERQALQLCPVVTDVAGDAGPIVTYDGRSLPDNQTALDILSVGADGNTDWLIASARIADMHAEPPAGYDTVGYTISWHRPDGRRFYAQAYRTGNVTTYSYGIDATADDGPSGALFGGVSTAGMFDYQRGVVSIFVPRDLLAGARTLPRYGATSWALFSGNTVGTYSVVDSTPLGAYRLGIHCGA